MMRLGQMNEAKTAGRETSRPAEMFCDQGSFAVRFTQNSLMRETGGVCFGQVQNAYLRLSPREMPMARAARISWPSMGTNLVLPATVESGLWATTLFIMPTA